MKIFNLIPLGHTWILQLEGQDEPVETYENMTEECVMHQVSEDLRGYSAEVRVQRAPAALSQGWHRPLSEDTRVKLSA